MFNKGTVKGLVSLSLVLTACLGSATSVIAQEEKPKRPHMDLAFCIDTTGSMGAEIEMVKKKTKELVAKLSSAKPAPIIRVGLVAYRDRGDAYVTKVFPFSDDIDKVVKDISDLQAAGGGDTPEALNQGLHAALSELTWDDDKKTAKLLFLIGDAGPHPYPNDYDWRDESKKAIARGIQINTIGCQGLEQAGATNVFQEIAKLSDGKFDTLAYRQEIVDAAGRKETIVTSGGEAYRLRAGAKDWKAGVSMGMMDKVAAPAPRAEMMMTRSLRGATMGTMAPMAAGEAGAGGTVAGMPTSRADSNLDELLLDAAKKKAEKALNVDYHH